MTTSTILSLIASLGAIIVAIISGLFSYFSSKRSTKVQAMQAYLGFLQHKMAKLEEGLKVANSNISSKQKDDTINYAKDIILNTSNHRKHILSLYGYLLTEDRKKILKEMVKTDAKLDFMMGVLNDKTHQIKYEGPIDEPIDILRQLADLNINYKELIVDELEATYKEFKELSLNDSAK